MARSYRDPFWLHVQTEKKCSKCEARIKRGDLAFYYQSIKAYFGGRCGCGDEAARDFAARTL